MNIYSNKTLALFALALFATSAFSAIQFDPAVTYPVGVNPESVAIADFNGDGFKDLAVANNNSDNVSILLNQGNGTFANAINFATGNGTSPFAIAAADFDMDGDQDLAVTLKNTNQVRIMKNSGGASFSNFATFSVGTEPRSIVTAKLDADSDFDLAVGNRTSGNVSVLLNMGDGTFGAATNYSTGQDVRSVSAGDLDGDGDQDLSASNHDSRTVTLLRNSGSGTFTFWADLSVGGDLRPDDSAIADLDKDGDSDIAVATSGNNNALNFASIFLNNGGTFSGPSNFTVGTEPVSIIAADLDGDGDMDIATANQSANSISILENFGPASFGAAMNLSTGGSSPTWMEAGMLDSDSDIDLVVVNEGSNNVSVFMNASAFQVLPNSFTVVRGTLLSGVVSDLFASDNLKLQVQRPRSQTLSEVKIIVDVKGTSSATSASTLKLTFEGVSSLSGATQKLYLFNYNTNSFELVDTRTASTTDSIVEVLISSNASRFINSSTGEIKGRAEWLKSGFTPPNWSVGIDQFHWSLTK
ncbi:MAG TPA: VCBS repeat-containing protein [Fimbriimonadales bacterium]|nr:VCBS repeat-containing protein [Fimbriimonadales bacterium]